MEEINRPLDLLNSLKGRLVEIKIKNSKETIKAQLLAFDIHINLVIMKDGKQEFIRGDEIVSIGSRE